MAFPSSNPQPHPNSNETDEEPGESRTSQQMVEQAAELGLMVRSESGRDPDGMMVGLMSAREGGGSPSMERGIESTRKSDFAVESSVPRVSQELKDALSTLQQAFVVSDATRPDYPIMYASAGFFSMTGYSAKEVTGRNW